MTHNEPHEFTAQRVADAIARTAAISYCSGMVDNQYAEICWSIIGLPDTNEIAVVVQVGKLHLALAELSPALFPTMADRIFGIDVADQQLAMELADRLWHAHSRSLVAEAMRLREC